jgi:microcystin-dependent protein
MATQLQFRRGTTAQNDGFTGAAGEISLDTDTNNIRIHDGATAGGAEIIPAGTIMAYGGASAPTGFVLCDNSAISRTTYAKLFGSIGTAFGVGDGSTTFNVPDLRDKVPLGKGPVNATLGTTTGSAGASSVLTSASKTGVTTATNTTGSTGGSTVANNTGSDGNGDLTVGTTTVASSAKDSSTTSVVNSVTQAAHTHTIPSLTVNGHTHSIPALSVDSFTVNTTLPSELVNYIIKL